MRLGLILAATLALLVAGGPAPVRLHVLPRIGQAPRDIRVTVRLVDPPEGQPYRGYCVTLEGSTGFGQQTCRERTDWRIREFYFRQVPAGHYSVRATVVTWNWTTLSAVDDGLCYHDIHVACQ